jgi:hypothetical protein
MKELYSMSVLHAAFSGGSVEIAERLLEKGIAEIDCRTGSHPEYLKSGFTPLHFAAFMKKPMLAELCISHGADVNAWTQFDPSAVSFLNLDPRWTAKWLHDGNNNAIGLCAITKCRSCLHVLLDADATLNVRQQQGLSTFQLAVRFYWDELLELILDSIEEDRQQAFLNEPNPITGDTALMYACMLLRTEMVEWLLSKRADPNMRCFDTDDHDFEVAPYPFYHFTQMGAFNEGRSFSFRNLSPLAFAAVGNHYKLAASENAAKVAEDSRLKVLDALADAGARLVPSDSRALELAKGIKSNERVVDWISRRMPHS